VKTRLSPVIRVVVMVAATVPWGNVVSAQDAAVAKDAVAKVTALRGTVTAQAPAGPVRELKLQDPLAVGDTVRTAANGRVQILFSDRTTMNLGRDTVMTITEYAYDPAAKKGALVTHVEEGVFRVMGGAITSIAPDSFRTVTPTATIGIRGSYYLGRQQLRQLTAIMLGGRGITVRNGRGQRVITRAGNGTIVRGPGSGPGAVRTFSRAEIDALIDLLLTADLPEGPSGVPRPSFGLWRLPNRYLFDIAWFEIWMRAHREGTGASQESDVLEIIADAETPSPDTPVPTPTPPDDNTQPRPYRQFYGFAIGAASTGESNLRDGHRYGDEIVQNTSPYSFGMRFDETTGELLDGSLSLTYGDQQTTGPVDIAGPAGGGYGFSTVFQDGTESSVSGVSGTIRTEGTDTWWSWGVWDMDFNGEDSHSHTVGWSEYPSVPAGYWVAGDLTPWSYLQSLIASSAVGVYNGSAWCTEIPGEGVPASYSGTSQFFVDFGAQTVNGQLSFNSGALQMGLAATFAQATNGFQGSVTGVTGGRSGALTPVSSSVNGAFFGPRANSLAGIYDALMSPGTRYFGAFGANGN
jgi:hypothetical protein